MSQGTVLVVEDDAALRETLVETLQLARYSVEAAENGEQALDCLEANKDISLLISDVQMSPMDGHELMNQSKERFPELPIILMTAYGTIEKAVEAIRDGANEYLVKPFEAETLIDMVSRYILSRGKDDDSFIAVDEKSKEIEKIARRVAASDVTVTISGESGVGKEVVSQFIHHQSSRAKGPFVAINCAAIPENMLESVLFGYEKGAFTGAYQARPGKFEQAQGGTLLLDEITEMDLSLQAKLLRVLQEREVERLGGRKVIALDVRILATTNRDMQQAVADGLFREDLFYRLNVFPLNLLPLRERADDIIPIAEKLMLNYTRGSVAVNFSQASVDIIKQHDWPGNVRELDNVIQRALILKTGNVVEAEDIRFEQIAGLSSSSNTVHLNQTTGSASAGQSNAAKSDLNSDLLDREKDLIISALRAKNNRKEVAEKLGISPRTLRYKLARLRDAGVALPT